MTTQHATQVPDSEALREEVRARYAMAAARPRTELPLAPGCC